VVNGKQKGSAFERYVVKKLSLWISKGERQDLFWRSAMSGGRATIRFRKGQSVKAQMGDITAVDPLGHLLTDRYYVECKNYQDFRMDRFVLKGSGLLQQFWDLTGKEAKKYGKKPMLICRQNGLPTFVLLPPSIMAPDASAIIPPAGCRLVLFEDLLLTTPPGPIIKRTR
jgi:hypothetical protein